MQKPFQTIDYQCPAPHVVRIVLDRPAHRNAQDTRMLYELNEAFDRAAQDDEIKVIILAATSPHFSAGHDLREPDKEEAIGRHRTVGTWCGFACDGAEGQMAREKEMYQGLSERWRNIAKPTIAAVQGRCISGGLMLVWPCDIIVAAQDAQFMDNTVAMGLNGAEYFAHPWELGFRKAKEMLFTADFLSADDAHRLGMVNHVVPVGELGGFTLNLAQRIARKPLFALKLAKESVNNAQDAQGRNGVMNAAFGLHQLAHSHNKLKFGVSIDPSGIDPAMRGKVVLPGLADVPD
ncbi:MULTISPECIES: enoyl-CoA hydratase [Sphingobium]|uniref:enoyl-CoA hydratase n=1 Tax=Sphingobium TaxID=165695 RepID=UPI00159C660C|nr:enoyl-CoA hydratase [Sphingobium sp. 15-1]